MKKLKRVLGNAHPLTEAQRREHQQIHEDLPRDVEVKSATRQIQAELQERRCEFADVVKALKEARESRGLSLQDVCDKTGITRASLSLMENGKGNPTMTTLRRVAEAIGVEILVMVKG